MSAGRKISALIILTAFVGGLSGAVVAQLNTPSSQEACLSIGGSYHVAVVGAHYCETV